MRKLSFILVVATKDVAPPGLETAGCSAQVPCAILYFTDKTIPWRATSRDNYHTTAL